MTYISYANLNSLEPTSFIAGTEYTLEYMVYDADGVTPVDIASATNKVLFSPYGRPDIKVLEKVGVASMTIGLFTVTLEKNDTINLSGKYTQQPVIIDFSGKEFALAQGEIIIQPRIQ